MEIKSIICPRCGATLEISEDFKQCFCSFCGSKMIIDDGTRTVRIIDEAKLKEIDLKRDEFEYKKEQETINSQKRAQKIKRWRLLVLASFSIFTLTLFLSCVLFYIYDIDILFNILCIASMFWPTFLAAIRPDNLYDVASPPFLNKKIELAIFFSLIVWCIIFVIFLVPTL
ncbi:hypothetical protein [uncultured Ruminococcus sp.]|uniref:hypothetical protein n=1 Tax=uncultured Ruminococcus sp. TaxID=165186 RepID=UPI0025E8B919|nr:hypothetical protein [uncultured Ruminococcus sp.]